VSAREVDPHEREALEGESGSEPRGGAAGGWSPAPAGAGQRSLSLGLIAMLPLLVAYELGALGALRALGALGAGATRNAAEKALFQAVELSGLSVEPVRRTALVAVALLAAAVCFRRRVALGPGVLRIVLEGLAGAVLLGPALALAMEGLGAAGSVRALGATPAGRAPELARAAVACGGAAYEEILFRVATYALLFVLLRRAGRFLGLSRAVARWAGELGGLLGSSILFAAFHLAAFTSWLGPGGEAFSPAAFTWRALAGILLALLFRWRGPGVAAWSHGLFNLALFIGAGPEVLP